MTIIDNIFLKELIEIRRRLHTYPELAYAEFNTTEIIEATLKQWNLNLQSFRQLKTGGYCDIGAGPLITFRADIDALPITENPHHQIASQNPGVMHACGHDYHIAFGLALLKYFSSVRSLNRHTLRVLFQPAEEAYPTGAVKVCAEPIWPEAKYFLTAHIQNDIPVGNVAVCQGVANASSSSIEITIIGRGGHTSRPHEGDDLVRISSALVTDLYAFLSEHINPMETYILVFGSIEGGKTHNVMPEKISLKGTLRTLKSAVKGQVINLCTEFFRRYALLYGIKIDFQNPTYCPPVVNDQQLFDLFVGYISQNDKDSLIKVVSPSLGADDFAFYLTKAPGLYIKIGGGGKGIAHSSDFEVNEAAFGPGVRILTGFIEYLDRVG